MGALLGILVIGLQIAGVVLTGMWAYDIVEPNGFFGFLGFLVFWGILEWAVFSVLGFMGAAFIAIFENK